RTNVGPVGKYRIILFQVLDNGVQILAQYVVSHQRKLHGSLAMIGVLHDIQHLTASDCMKVFTFSCTELHPMPTFSCRVSRFPSSNRYLPSTPILSIRTLIPRRATQSNIKASTPPQPRKPSS